MHASVGMRLDNPLDRECAVPRLRGLDNHSSGCAPVPYLGEHALSGAVDLITVVVVGGEGRMYQARNSEQRTHVVLLVAFEID
jgi:hypothetical protein